MNDILISCVCPTHGRGHLVNEAVESYRRQNFRIRHPGETELLILNDCPEQPLLAPAGMADVRVINLEEPYRNLSYKFNAAVLEARGKYVAWWEDDDVSLCFRLDVSIQRIQQTNSRGYKQGMAWMWNNWRLDAGLHSNLFYGSSMFERRHYLACGGADPADFADLTAWNRLVAAGGMLDETPLPAEAFFIYRWAGMGHHDSAVKGTNSDRFEAFRTRTLTDPRFVPGPWEIVPVWHQAYDKMVDECRRCM